MQRDHRPATTRQGFAPCELTGVVLQTRMITAVSAAATSFISSGRYVLASRPHARIALVCAFGVVQLWFFVRFTAWQWIG